MRTITTLQVGGSMFRRKKQNSLHIEDLYESDEKEAYVLCLNMNAFFMQVDGKPSVTKDFEQAKVWKDELSVKKYQQIYGGYLGKTVDMIYYRPLFETEDVSHYTDTQFVVRINPDTWIDDYAGTLTLVNDIYQAETYDNVKDAEHVAQAVGGQVILYKYVKRFQPLE